ncbi:putative phosphate transport protein (TIGR00153 family) [Scopulibacillus daqui]|uniref:Phosphate transport protein (TIGR00153 family) n=1 Tax=Scopulibacillus daqui TaxID=1469162 RepID=A0ABS2PXE9_9BACL|nr:putative phosphate transport protein (TIGR00153 family) [Scopulibacillus daqui]
MIFNAKHDKFLNLLKQISLNLKESTQFFVDFHIHQTEDLDKFSTVMKKYENKGDAYIHELIIKLNKTFITPLEREDILNLALKMDDVLDGYEEWAKRIVVYQIKESDKYMKKFADYLLEATKEIAKSMDLLSRRKFFDIQKHIIKINDFESECDCLIEDSLRHLFQTEKDPIKVIQHKELYEMLEEIADSCEDVADMLETIIMKNA